MLRPKGAGLNPHPLWVSKLLILLGHQPAKVVGF
jgi:hypothetical protein